MASTLDRVKEVLAPHRELVAMAVLFCAYLLAQLLGAQLFRPPALILPAAAVAVAGLVIGGIRLWPAIFLAAVVGYYIRGVDAIWILGLALAHSIQAITAASLLKLFNFDPVFRRVRDMFAYMFVAGVASTIVPTIGFAINELDIRFLGGSALTPYSWGTWWVGISMSILIFGSVIIRFASKVSFTRTAKEWVEIGAAFTILSILSYVLFWTNSSQQTSGLVILFYLVPFVWFAIRLGMRFTLLAFALTTVLSITGAFFGYTDSPQPLGRRLLTIEIWNMTIATIFYLFVAMVEERKRATRQLNAQLERVHALLEESKRADRAKSEFIAVFAHELRNPLAPIVSAVELLKLKWTANPELGQIVHTIEDRTKTIVRLLDDLLDISRINEGKLRLKKEHTDLQSIIKRAVASIQPHITRRHQDLYMSMPDHNLTLDADPVRIEQIVSNLLNNASKFTPDGGRIEIVALQRASYAEVTIRDNGVGIDPRMLPKIFEPFLQIDTSHRLNEGLGIGLSLTQRLVEVHGGTISAHSDGKDKGASFTVSLPLSSLTSIPHIMNNEQTRMQHNALRILVVDDNEAAANGLGTLLKHVGNEVDFAYVGADVPQKVAEFQPNVIVLDIGLPDISGYDVASDLRKNGYNGNIIALTGYGQDEDKKKAQEAGFNYHLTKPVGLADLQAVLIPKGA